MDPPAEADRHAEWKVGVLSGVVASVVVLIFVEPILGLTWRAASAVLGTIAQGTLDRVYQSAALGHRNYMGVRVVVFLAGASLGALTSLMVMGLFVWRRGVDAVIQPSEQQRRLVAVLAVLVFISFVGWMQLTAATLYADLQYTTSFEQQLTVLAPGIDDQLEEELRASWASMTTRTDFLAVMADLASVADSVGIQLPPRSLQ